MTREKLGVLLDAKDKICNYCDAIYCDICRVPKVIEKQTKVVKETEKKKCESRNL